MIIVQALIGYATLNLIIISPIIGFHLKQRINRREADRIKSGLSRNQYYLGA